MQLAKMAFPTYTKTFHTKPYPAIDPSRPELSTAGKVILITGGGSGIGPRIVHAFAVSGATKISILGRTASSLLQTKREVEAAYPGVEVLTYVADLVGQAAINAAFAATKLAFGPIDILISNAAYFPTHAPLASADIDEWFRGYEVNVKGGLILAQAFLKYSSANPTLVHIGTGPSHAPPLPGGVSAYGTSKLAAAKVIEYLGFENPHVRVHIVHPGSIDTEMSKKAAAAGLSLPFEDGMVSLSIPLLSLVLKAQVLIICVAVELPASFVVWITSPEAEFLKGKFVWDNWDIEELLAKKYEIQSSLDLTLGLVGWL